MVGFRHQAWAFCLFLARHFFFLYVAAKEESPGLGDYCFFHHSPGKFRRVWEPFWFSSKSLYQLKYMLHLAMKGQQEKMAFQPSPLWGLLLFHPVPESRKPEDGNSTGSRQLPGSPVGISTPSRIKWESLDLASIYLESQNARFSVLFQGF